LRLRRFYAIIHLKVGDDMKKDIFNFKIKPEYRGYVTSSIFVAFVVFFGLGLLLFYFVSKTVEFDMKVTIFVLACAFSLLGILFPIATIFSIRKYPKYKRLRKLLLNSDYYFVGENEKLHRGSNFGIFGAKNKIAFDVVTDISDKNANAYGKAYPPKYKSYISMLVIGISLFFLNIMIFNWYSRKNISDEKIAIAFLLFVVFKIVIIVLLFILAFRIKKIREDNK